MNVDISYGLVAHRIKNKNHDVLCGGWSHVLVGLLVHGVRGVLIVVFLLVDG